MSEPYWKLVEQERKGSDLMVSTFERYLPNGVLILVRTLYCGNVAQSLLYIPYTNDNQPFRP